jgi:4-hydroxy-3-polyprenylbenzoate decarboxylase
MKRLIVGISGATGVLYGIRLLETLKGNAETHLIITRTAERIIANETTYAAEDVRRLASRCYSNDDMFAPVCSGSFRTEGMVVVPCSIKSLSGIAHSYNDTLLTRAADVTLKERRRLILAVRETPLHLGHIRLLLQASENGAVILPPMPAFYHEPKTVDDIIDQTLGKILDLLDIGHDLFVRWGGR